MQYWCRNSGTSPSIQASRVQHRKPNFCRAWSVLVFVQRSEALRTRVLRTPLYLVFMRSHWLTGREEGACSLPWVSRQQVMGVLVGFAR